MKHYTFKKQTNLQLLFLIFQYKSMFLYTCIAKNIPKLYLFSLRRDVLQRHHSCTFPRWTFSLWYKNSIPWSLLKLKLGI